MIKLSNILNLKPIWKKTVAFFGGLGIIISTIISISQLTNIPDKQQEEKQFIAYDSNKNETINQGDQGSIGNKNTNIWNNKRDEIKTDQRYIIIQGNQSSHGNNNVNNWNNTNNNNRENLEK